MRRLFTDRWDGERADRHFPGRAVTRPAGRRSLAPL